MGHPVIDEMYRCFSLSNVRNEAFRRWQRVLHDEVNPAWDDYERMKARVAELEAELADETDPVGTALDQVPTKRRGRPRKEPAAV